MHVNAMVVYCCPEVVAGSLIKSFWKMGLGLQSVPSRYKEDLPADLKEKVLQVKDNLPDQLVDVSLGRFWKITCFQHFPIFPIFSMFFQDLFQCERSTACFFLPLHAGWQKGLAALERRD